MNFEDWWEKWQAQGRRVMTWAALAQTAWDAGQAELRTPMECGHPKACLQDLKYGIPPGQGDQVDSMVCSVCMDLDKVKAERDTLEGIDKVCDSANEHVLLLQADLDKATERITAMEAALPAIADELRGIGESLWSTNAIRGRQVAKYAERLRALLAPTVPPAEPTIKGEL